MRIGLFLKEELEDSDISTLIISKISEHGFDFDLEDPEYVIFVGGDGTFLRAVNTFIDDVDNITFVGINEGSLGFYTEYLLSEVDQLLYDLEEGNFNVKSVKLLQADIGDEHIYAVNEIRVENPFHTLICKVYIDNDYLEVFRGNGLCIASSIGSSAYNKSLGGSIVLSNINTLQLTEIAPINNRIYNSISSSLILSDYNSITLEGDFTDVVFGYDYMTSRGKKEVNKVTVSLADKYVNIFYRTHHSFVEKIRESLLK